MSFDQSRFSYILVSCWIGTLDLFVLWRSCLIGTLFGATISGGDAHIVTKDLTVFGTCCRIGLGFIPASFDF